MKIRIIDRNDTKSMEGIEVTIRIVLAIIGIGTVSGTIIDVFVEWDMTFRDYRILLLGIAVTYGSLITLKPEKSDER